MLHVQDCFHVDKQCNVAANREPQCPNNSWSTPTASIFNDVYTFLSSNLRKTSTSTFPTLPIAAIAQIESVNLEAVVMLGHSLGGSVAVDILTGSVHPSLC